MHSKSRVALIVAAGFVVFALEGLLSKVDSAGARALALWMPTAGAATSCPAPSIEALARTWTVRSTGCSGDCRDAHVAVGDKFTFLRNYEERPSFSLDVKPVDPNSRKAMRTAGHTLASDGVSNAVGEIVLTHNLLDGTPLQTHWLIVMLRAYDLDGSGDCQLAARVAVCDQEPAKGATACSAQQHNGFIHLGP